MSSSRDEEDSNRSENSQNAEDALHRENFGKLPKPPAIPSQKNNVEEVLAEEDDIKLEDAATLRTQLRRFI